LSSTLQERPTDNYTTARKVIPDEQAATWRKRLNTARNDRRRFEPVWKMNLAFAAGKQWLEWKPFGRGGRFVLPRLKEGQQRYTVNKIEPLRRAVLAQLSLDDSRPQLLFTADDLPSEDYVEVANDALAAGWEQEWQGDRAWEDALRILIDLGTAGIRCRFDPTAGPARQRQVPHDGNGPILDPERAREYVANQQLKGASANLKTIHEGRIRWDVATPFNLLVPAGIKREDKFPWACWVEPVHLDKVREQYGSLANGLVAEPIDDITGLGDSESSVMGGGDLESGNIGMAKMEDHVFVYTVYERPCPDYPDGQVLVFAGGTLRPMEVRPQLPFVAPDGTRRDGIHFLHYSRLSDRFWSRGLVDDAKDPQRIYNRRSSQIGEHIDKGQAFVMADERAVPKRIGVPVEIIKLKPGFPAPTVSPGVPVGPWMETSLDRIEKDLNDTTGVSDVLAGENPANVGNYAQLALLQEQAGQKFEVISAGLRDTRKHLVEDSVWAIRQFWGPDRALTLEGSNGELKAFSFDATKLPDWSKMAVAKGATKPRTQAAQLKMVDDLAAYSINSGDPLPLDWVKSSYDEGEPVDLPETDRHDDLDAALFENQKLENGQPCQVEYYQDHAMHVQVHRSIQAQADLTGNTELSGMVEQHVQAHLLQAQANVMFQQQGQTPHNVTAPPPGTPQGPVAPNILALALAQHGAAPAPGATPIPVPNAFSLFRSAPSYGRSGFGGA
jgi:hypothetical protein